MRPFGVCFLSAWFVFISAASPVSQGAGREATPRAGAGEGPWLGLDSATAARKYRDRNLEKHRLVFDRTVRILGPSVQEILNDSRQLMIKPDAKTSPIGVDFGRMLKDGYSRHKTLVETKDINSLRSADSDVLPTGEGPSDLASWTWERRMADELSSGAGHDDVDLGLELLNLNHSGSSLSAVLRDLLTRLTSLTGNSHQDSNPPCQMWADCRWKVQEVLISGLPSCPCSYPSQIFYDDSLWDENKQRLFRWKDASGASERLDVYKPGADRCIRSIATDLLSIAAQHCCYDKEHGLLTRGSGAGSPNLVSPDISPLLHYRVDTLPWHHCKGDFTRFNKVRPPDNGNNCSLNPSEEEYRRQVDLATSF